MQVVVSFDEAVLRLHGLVDGREKIFLDDFRVFDECARFLAPYLVLQKEADVLRVREKAAEERECVEIDFEMLVALLHVGVVVVAHQYLVAVGEVVAQVLQEAVGERYCEACLSFFVQAAAAVFEAGYRLLPAIAVRW